MRLEVFCHDRIGLTRELLDLLVERDIDLRGIEIASTGRIYLNFTAIDFTIFSALMSEIRRIPGVTDVRTVSWMPSELEHRALSALLIALPDPVFSLDLKTKIELTNPAAQQLFALSEEKLRGCQAGHLISDFNFSRWLECGHPEPQAQHVVLQGRDFLLEITPIYTPVQLLSGAVVMLKSTARMGRQLQNLAVSDDAEFQHVVAVSSRMRQLVEQARKLAMLDAPLLLVGETGTGKDLLARACHLRSARGKKPFLALNCASLPDDVAESELFGHAAGAYPNALEGKKGFFEQANGGSVLLDEIGEMSPRMQTKLLRFLNDGTFRRVGEEQEVHVDVRVICATQKNLLELVRRGEFREDLYYRLNVLTLTLPALRERTQDILPLSEMFVAQFADELAIVCPRISASLTAFMIRYSWPGNVRQLRNALYRAMTQLEGSLLEVSHIATLLPENGDQDAMISEENLDGSLDEITRRFERSVLTRLYISYPSTRKLARRLGVSHTAIANKLREYGLGLRRSDQDDKENPPGE
ncbi:DNA-binding transcriptional regulator TyrR [Erwinia sp. OLTSP20]|uniref:transcriptional regulator TyrR n=1 Tax=unclassified Erwinia TaxID=2622719 RepID=UPI000C1A6F3B|nr:MULTISPECIES: transcriptional regulator TyrR [unclassified Erwinia]PIJ51770.1 DNA-binding transcriptional regulator TyrR [Erwinia sp. OAMSP11]PIJ74359.1 DNA-binding transcriptional regulator TyrR [Erwinia sp. OLSSP12]PIJ83808.1 DNA-binding transcriptional regulator TyrR [Erwinia sp. OLCASP19]PIJ86851.1 DNA-binding transcriptional regulator TyrR [Erwinia sp. OLMTSP26]PIJ88258.1 DNA-binding transcriptional regulator TyrR [Erwinia sp. OLMDSP33]